MRYATIEPDDTPETLERTFRRLVILQHATRYAIIREWVGQDIDEVLDALNERKQAAAHG